MAASARLEEHLDFACLSILHCCVTRFQILPNSLADIGKGLLLCFPLRSAPYFILFLPFYRSTSLPQRMF